MVTYVSTRVGFGSNSLLSATTITPSSYSLMEPVGIGTTRWWKYTATADGALRVDGMLSQPGSYTTAVGSSVRVAVAEFEADPPTTIPVLLHCDNGYSASFLSFSYTTAYNSLTNVYSSGSFIAEAGKVYLISLTATGGLGTWGLVLRLSSLRPVEPTFYQPADRTVTDYTASNLNYSNTTPLNSWDTILGSRQTADFTTNGAGSFKWERSFKGLDPVTEIPSYLAVDLPWKHALHGIPRIEWCNADLDGRDRSIPPPPPWQPRQWGSALGGENVFSYWDYGEGGLGGIFNYESSQMVQQHFYQSNSLHWERWKAGPRVGYTDAELAAIAGVSLTSIVGFIFEDELPEILAVQVIADGYGPLGDNPTEVQWWAGITRFKPEIATVVGNPYPLPAGSYGPVHSLQGAGSIPVTYYLNYAGLIEGGEDARPYDYIREMNMSFLGVWTGVGDLPVWDVPEEIWREGLDLEDTMLELDTFSSDDPQFQHPLGLTFLAGLSEQLAENPVGPGLPVPFTGRELKGFTNVVLWPKITYRPSRFQVALAPELEFPLLQPTGGPLNLRAHFEPIPPG